MQKLKIISFHGGYLGYDIIKSTLNIYKHGFDTNAYQVYYDGQNIFINLGHSKKYISYENKNFILKDISDKTISCINNIKYIYLKIGETYLSSRLTNEVSLCASKPLDWEKFYIKYDYFDKNKNLFHDLNTYEIGNKNTKKIEKNIWVYWEGNMPLLVEKCIERLKKFNKNYNLHVLNEKNISNYIDIEINKELTPTFKSDIIRLKLLYEYGGIWVDSSTITNTSLDEILRLENNDNFYDLTGFYRSCQYLYDIPCIESWLLAAPKKSYTVKIWLDHLIEANYSSPDNLLDKIKLDKNFKVIKNNFKEENFKYFLIYLSQQKTFLDNINNISVKAFCADNSAFYYKDKYGWNNKNRYIELLFNRENEILMLPKIIKLTKGDRNLFNSLKDGRETYIKKYSYLYSFIFE